MGRPRTDPGKLARAVQAARDGVPRPDAAAAAGVSVRVLDRALEADRPVVGELDEADRPTLDATGDPLLMARSLAASLKWTIDNMPADHPRLNPARESFLRCTGRIEAMERVRAAAETPADVEARLRREDGATRREVERYVEGLERAAAADGKCIWCSQPLPTGEG